MPALASYATVADLVAEFGEPEIRDLTDRAEPPLGEVVAAVAQRALDRAETTVNGYLSGRYSIPVPADAVKGYVLDLARRFLYVSTMPEVVKDRYESAIRDLRQIGQGLMSLPVPASAQPTPSAVSMKIRTRPKTFGDL